VVTPVVDSEVTPMSSWSRLQNEEILENNNGLEIEKTNGARRYVDFWFLRTINPANVVDCVATRENIKNVWKLDLE